MKIVKLPPTEMKPLKFLHDMVDEGAKEYPAPIEHNINSNALLNHLIVLGFDPENFTMEEARLAIDLMKAGYMREQADAANDLANNVSDVATAIDLSMIPNYSSELDDLLRIFKDYLLTKQ
ncbi:hypothetical protein ACYCEW_004721 [Enterobacter hormaechei]